jgi:hypothetical protein
MVGEHQSSRARRPTEGEVIRDWFVKAVDETVDSSTIAAMRAVIETTEGQG